MNDKISLNHTSQWVGVFLIPWTLIWNVGLTYSSVMPKRDYSHPLSGRGVYITPYNMIFSHFFTSWSNHVNLHTWQLWGYLKSTIYLGSIKCLMWHWVQSLFLVWSEVKHGLSLSDSSDHHKEFTIKFKEFN